MPTTLIDVKNVLEQEVKLSPESAERVATVWNDFVKEDSGLATKVELEALRGELRLVKWIGFYTATAITIELVSRWFF